MEEIIGPLIAAVFGIAALIAFIYFTVYIGIPLAIVSAVYLAYCYHRDHPNTQARQNRKQAEQLYQTLTARQPFSADDITGEFGWLKPVGDRLCMMEGLQVPPLPPEGCTPLEIARYVDTLSLLATKLTDSALLLAYNTIRDSMLNFEHAIPELAPGSFETTVGEAMKNTAGVVEAIIIPFYQSEVIQSGLFQSLRAQLDRNMHQMSGIPYIPENFGSPKLVLPRNHKGTPQELIHGYLTNTPLIQPFLYPITFGIPEEPRFSGTWIVAPHGTGKTTLLSVLFKEDLKLVEQGKASIIVMDGKGDFALPISHLEQFGPKGSLSGKFTLVEPHDNLSINFLDLGTSRAETINLLEGVFSTFDAKTSSNMQSLLRMVLLLCTHIPNATLVDFRRIIAEGWETNYRDYVEKLDPDEQIFFTKEFKGSNYNETKAAILARLRRLSTESDTLKGMFKATETKLKMADRMDKPGVTVIDTSWKKLTFEGSEFYSRFLIALILAAAHQRSGRAYKLPVFVYIDECQSVIANEPKIAQIIQTCRSQKIALTMAHQELQQIKNDDVKAALGNCVIRIANSDDDAPALASKMRTTADQLRSLHIGQFALFIRDQMAQPLIVNVPDDPVSGWSPMSDPDFAAIREDMKKRYCYPREALQTPAPPSDAFTNIPQPASDLTTGTTHWES